MYNETVKNLFLEGLPTDTQRVNFVSLFYRTQPLESRLNKDLSHFTKDECLEGFASLKPSSVGHMASLKSNLVKYGRWAKENGYADKNWWVLVSTKERFAAARFSSRHVKDINELEHLVDTGLSTPYDKYVIYLLYMGAKNEKFTELANIKNTDANKLNRTIKTEKRTYSGDEIPAPLWKIIDVPGYYSETKKREDNSPYLVKPFDTYNTKDDPASPNYVYRTFRLWCRNLEKAGIEKAPTPTTIWHSGMYNMAYQIEQQKGGTISNDEYEVIKQLFGYNGLIGHFLEEYELYKEVFWSNDLI